MDSLCSSTRLYYAVSRIDGEMYIHTYKTLLISLSHSVDLVGHCRWDDRVWRIAKEKGTDSLEQSSGIEARELLFFWLGLRLIHPCNNKPLQSSIPNAHFPPTFLFIFSRLMFPIGHYRKSKKGVRLITVFKSLLKHTHTDGSSASRRLNIRNFKPENEVKTYEGACEQINRRGELNSIRQ